MSIERENIESLFGLALSIREARKEDENEAKDWQKGYLLIVRKDNNEIVARVSYDDLFDKYGNRFNT